MDIALAAGIVLGLVAAQFVPVDTACSLRGKQAADAEGPAESLSGKS